jgi:DNA polymerase bacteriophage-type
MENPIDLVSRMLRGSVIAKPGHKLIFGDYSNVEARASVWAAGQQDQVDLFASGGKIYEEMGAAIYGMSVDEVIAGHADKSNPMPRFVGKETILGCGYGVGPAKFMSAIKKKSRIILPPELAEKAVYGWREKNYRVVEFWREIERAARNAIEAPGRIFSAGPFSYRKKGAWLQCRLPSGRIIWYCRPRIEPRADDANGRWAIHYWTLNGITKQWEKTVTWGGKLLQNAIEGLCRDFLAGAKLKLDGMGYTIVLSVHDEAIAEVPEGFGSVSEFLSVMTELPQWGAGFPLKAEGSEGRRYAKA